MANQINVASMPGGGNNQNGTFVFLQRRAYRCRGHLRSYRRNQRNWVWPIAIPKLADAYTIYRSFLYE